MTIGNKSTISAISNLPGQKGSGGTPPTPPPQPTPDQFTTPTDTGINMTVLVNASAVVNTPYAGGELGAFYDLNGDGNLQCVALSTITSGPFSLVIWGDNGSTPEKDGLISIDPAIRRNKKIKINHEIITSNSDKAFYKLKGLLNL